MSSTSSSINSASTPSPTPTLNASSTSFAAPTSCPSASCTRPGRTTSSLLACASDTLLFTAVPPLIFDGSPTTLPSGADGKEGPPTYKVLRATGQPRARRALSLFDIVIDDLSCPRRKLDLEREGKARAGQPPDGILLALGRLPCLSGQAKKVTAYDSDGAGHRVVIGSLEIGEQSVGPQLKGCA